MIGETCRMWGKKIGGGEKSNDLGNVGKCGGVVKLRDWRKSKDSRSRGKPKGLRKLKTEEEGRKERNGDVYKRGPCDAKVKKVL